MTDPDLVAKKLSLIETCVAELRRLARPDALDHDVVQERFITLQIAIQAALDVASHIVSDERLGEPRNRAALFESLHRGGWIERQLVDVLRLMAGFRNVLVHGYDEVDLTIVRGIVSIVWTICWRSSLRSGPGCRVRHPIRHKRIGSHSNGGIAGSGVH